MHQVAGTRFVPGVSKRKGEGKRMMPAGELSIVVVSRKVKPMFVMRVVVLQV